MNLAKGSTIKILASILILASIVLIAAWAFNLYAFGVYVDEHGEVGRTRVVDVVLPLVSIGLFAAGVAVARKSRQTNHVEA